jgi:hypothetical protein
MKASHHASQSEATAGHPPGNPTLGAPERGVPEAPLRIPLPAGYRGGVITAVTVFIGFSLSFVRYWGFEAPGQWTSRSIAVFIALLIPILAEIYALYRALLVSDDDEAAYATTIKWFVWSVCGMLVAVCFAAIVMSGALTPGTS